MFVRESTIESKTCDYAKTQGWTVYKFVSPGRRGVPDHLFMKHGRQLIFIEFKRQTEVSNAQQKREQQRIRDCGFEVYECWSVEQGRAIFSGL